MIHTLVTFPLWQTLKRENAPGHAIRRLFFGFLKLREDLNHCLKCFIAKHTEEKELGRTIFVSPQRPGGFLLVLFDPCKSVCANRQRMAQRSR